MIRCGHLWRLQTDSRVQAIRFLRGPIDSGASVSLIVVCSSRSAEFHSAPPDRYRANLKAIIETNRMRFPAASILIVSQYRVLSYDHHNCSDWRQSAYTDSAQEVASALSVGYLDLSQLWGLARAAESNRQLIKDLVHPSDEGGRQIACEMERAILPSRKIQCGS